MAPIALILLGIVVHVLNARPGVHIGFKGLPWLDVPSTLVVAGLVAGIAGIETRRRRKARSGRAGEEVEAAASGRVRGGRGADS